MNAQQMNTYRRALAEASARFMDENPDCDTGVMVLGLLSMCQGLYRTMDGATKEAFMNTAHASWDFMDQHGDAL